MCVQRASVCVCVHALTFCARMRMVRTYIYVTKSLFVYGISIFMNKNQQIVD